MLAKNSLKKNASSGSSKKPESAKSKRKKRRLCCKGSGSKTNCNCVVEVRSWAEQVVDQLIRMPKQGMASKSCCYNNSKSICNDSYSLQISEARQDETTLLLLTIHNWRCSEIHLSLVRTSCITGKALPTRVPTSFTWNMQYKHPHSAKRLNWMLRLIMLSAKDLHQTRRSKATQTQISTCPRKNLTSKWRSAMWTTNSNQLWSHLPTA